MVQSKKRVKPGNRKVQVTKEESGAPRFFQLLEVMAEIHRRKNNNYASKGTPLSNFDKAQKLGVPAWKGVLIRCSDKWSRIEELSNGKIDLVDESLADTMIDLANYAVIALILLERELGVKYGLNARGKLVAGSPLGTPVSLATARLVAENFLKS